MNTAPNTAMRVQNLDESIRFYVNTLGCELRNQDISSDVAIVACSGYSILLIGPRASNVNDRLSSIGEIVRPGATVFFDGGRAADIGNLKSRLEARGAWDVELIEREWGDRTVLVRDPDGYTIAFWTTVERSPAETLALYVATPDTLESAVDGLSTHQQLLRNADGEWSIREIVHHLVDADATVLFRTKFGLAEPGRTIVGNAYQQDRWADGLAYSQRDIGASVLLFRAIRGHISQIMQTVPDAWTRHTLSPDGGRMDAGAMLGMLVSHACEHIEDIRDIRRLHGV